MNHAAMINALIMNDGWIAFEQGQPISACPYPDDPFASEIWIHGYKRAEEYLNWKTIAYSKWDKRSQE